MGLEPITAVIGQEEGVYPGQAASLLLGNTETDNYPVSTVYMDSPTNQTWMSLI